MRLIKKFASYASGSLLALLLGLISSPIITRIISPEQMGKYSMFLTVSSLLLILIEFGLDQAYVRFYYEEEKENRFALLVKCIKIPIIISFVINLILLLFYKTISNYIVNETSFRLCIWLCIYNYANIISRFILLQIRMEQKAKLYSLLNILLKVFYIILAGLGYAVLGDTCYVLIIAMTLGTMCVALIGIAAERREIAFNNTLIKTNYHDMMKYGLPLALSSSIYWILQSIDRIMLKEYSTYTQIGIYSGAASIISLLTAVQTAFTTFWVPVAYEKYSNNPDDKTFFSKINECITIVIMLLTIMLITFKDIIGLLLGEKYREAVYVIPFLAFMPIMYAISETTVVGINFLKKSKWHIIIAVVSSGANVVGNYFLVPILGAKGAGIATGLSYVVFFYLRTIISKKYYKVNYHILRFTWTAIMVYTLGIYASFHRLDGITVAGALLVSSALLFMYRAFLMDAWKSFNKYLAERK